MMSLSEFRHPVCKWFPDRDSAFVAPSVRIFYSTRIRANLLSWKQEKTPRQVLSCLKNGVCLSFHPPPSPVCISIVCDRQGRRVHHTGPVRRGQFGHIHPVPVSRIQLSQQNVCSHASEQKTVNGAQLPLFELLFAKSRRVDTSKSRIFTSSLLRPHD